MKRTERRIKKLLRNKRNQYWDDNAELLEQAFNEKDMRLYYKRIKTLHGKSIIKDSASGNQLLTGQQVRQLDNKTLTTSEEETVARWIQHFTMLFNQPGEIGPEIESKMQTG